MKKLSEKVLYEGAWLTLKEAVYINKKGETFKWEFIERKSSPHTVAIIAKLIPSQRFILIKQFRPAINNYVIGFPAGVLPDYNNIDHALVELKEETGYTGEIVSVSPEFKTTTGIMDSSSRVVMAKIDENDPLNISPEQDLEPEEDIEVILLKEADIKSFLLAEQKKGTAIGSGPWSVFCNKDFIE